MRNKLITLLTVLLVTESLAQAQINYRTINISSSDNSNNWEEISFVPTVNGTATITYTLSGGFPRGGANVEIGSMCTNFPLFTANLTYDYGGLGNPDITGGPSPSSIGVTAGTTYFLGGSGTIFNPQDISPMGQGYFQATLTYPVASDNDFEWDGSYGNWTVLSNWLELDNPDGSCVPDYAAVNLPGSSDSVFILNGGIPEINSSCYAGYVEIDQNSSLHITAGTLTVEHETIGSSDTGNLNHTGGSTLLSNLYVGFNAGSSGIYMLSDNALLTSTNIEEIGEYGQGNFNQIGGTNTAQNIQLGAYTGSVGTYNLSAGFVNVDGFLQSGYYGTGEFNQTGGFVNVTGMGLFLGSPSVGTGSGNYSLSNNGSLISDDETVTSGNFYQSSGSNCVIDTLTVGDKADYVGNYLLSGGILTVFGNEFVGINGSAAFTQTGGTHIVGGYLTLAADTGSSGTFYLSGGTLVASNGMTINQGGVLTGTGMVNSTVFNAGILLPGNPSGELQINGSYSQSPNGALNLTLGGTNAGSKYSQVIISGAASLNGSINVGLTNGYVPQTGDQFTIMTAGSIGGQFSTINCPQFTNGLALVPQYYGTYVVLVAVPTNSINPPYSVQYILSNTWARSSVINNLDTNNNNRGMCYLADSNIVIVNNKGSHVITTYDGNLGTSNGFVNSTGISGGTFTLDKIDASIDGFLYGDNLNTAVNVSSAFKLYRWSNIISAPFNCYSTTTGDAIATFTASAGNQRIGDTFTVTGSGTNTLVLTGLTGTNAFALFSTTNGFNFVPTIITIPGNQLPAPGTYGVQFGIAFYTNNTFMINPNGVSSYLFGSGLLYLIQFPSNFSKLPSPVVATVIATNAGFGGDYNTLSYNPVAGLLACHGNATEPIALFSLPATNFSDLALLATTNLSFLTSSSINGNETGETVLGGPGLTNAIYTLDTSAGIQATMINFIVQRATPSLTWPSPNPISYGNSLSTIQLNATSSMPGYFLYNPPLGAVLPIGTNTLSVIFTPYNTVDYNVVTNYVKLIIVTSPVIQTVSQFSTRIGFTWSAMTKQTYQVQFTTGLAPANWINLGGPVTATNPLMNITAPIGTNSQQFYRVILAP